LLHVFDCLETEKNSFLKKVGGLFGERKGELEKRQVHVAVDCFCKVRNKAVVADLKNRERAN